MNWQEWRDAMAAVKREAKPVWTFYLLGERGARVAVPVFVPSEKEVEARRINQKARELAFAVIDLRQAGWTVTPPPEDPLAEYHVGQPEIPPEPPKMVEDVPE